MNRAEVVKIIRTLSVNYRNWPEEGKVDDTVTLWENALADIPAEVGQAAAMAHLSRSPYEPKISDIRDLAAKISQPNVIDAIEAWGMVTDAIRRYGMYREAEAMASLPTDVALMVRRFGFREICISENPDTLRAQFRMAWDAHAKNVREHGVMPKEIQNMIESSGLIKRIEGGQGA